MFGFILHGGYYRTLIKRLWKITEKLNYKAISRISGTIVLGNSLKAFSKE